MHEREISGRTRDPVEEAGGGSFPASDPPAWTVARAGKPEARAGKRARRAGGRSLPGHCAVIGLFRSPSAAQAAAAALLGAGFNRVDIGPPLRFGEIGGGIGARADRASAIGVLAAFGAIAAAGVAALVVPRRALPAGGGCRRRGGRGLGPSGATDPAARRRSGMAARRRAAVREAEVAGRPAAGVRNPGDGGRVPGPRRLGAGRLTGLDARRSRLFVLSHINAKYGRGRASAANRAFAQPDPG